MTIERTELLDKLEIVMPALADNNMLPVLSHVWFTGTNLVAYNERIALVTKMPSEFTGAVPGRLLVDMLKASGARQVELSSDGENLRVKAHNANIRLRVMAPQSFEGMFTIPSVPREAPVPSPEFMAGVQDCLRSVSNYSVMPEALGVTVVPNGGSSVALYSTDRATMTYAKVKAQAVARVILPSEFCIQMLRLSGAEHKALVVRRDHALFVADDTLLYGKLIHTEAPLDFGAAIHRHTKTASTLIKMPDDIGAALERATLITDIKGRDVATKIVVRNGWITFQSQSERGELTDKVKAPGHPDVEMEVVSARVKQGYQHYDEIAFTPTSVIMRRGAENIHLVATRGG